MLTLATARAAIEMRMSIMLDAASTDHASLLTRRAACPLSPP